MNDELLTIAVRQHDRNIKHKNWTEWEDTKFLAMALAGEVGELLNLLKKKEMGYPIPEKEISMEIADIEIYLNVLKFIRLHDSNKWAKLKLEAFEDKLKLLGR